MSEYYSINYSSNYISHHGVKGMKWGVRKQKLASGIKKVKKKFNEPETKAKIKKAVKIGAGIAVAGLAIYGAYKFRASKRQYEAIISLGKKMHNQHLRNEKVYNAMTNTANNFFKSGDRETGQRLIFESDRYGLDSANYKKAEDILNKAANNTAYYKINNRLRNRR